MKNILLKLLLFASVSFSQILQKQEIIHPGKCFGVNSIDSVTYLFMESGITILGNSQFPSHRFISKYTGFTAKPGLISAIIQNYMIVYQSDTLYYFDISNLFHPVQINRWRLNSPLTNLYPFGNHFILRSGNILDLYSPESDSLIEYLLSDAYPNPFNPTTTINYRIPASGLITLRLYDMLGNEVATLVNDEKPPGSYNYKLSTANLQLPSGIYFYRLQARDFADTKKIILLK